MLIPFDGLQNVGGVNNTVAASPSLAHAVRMILAIPF
jgi:hypothetical protein